MTLLHEKILIIGISTNYTNFKGIAIVLSLSSNLQLSAIASCDELQFIPGLLSADKWGTVHYSVVYYVDLLYHIDI